MSHIVLIEQTNFLNLRLEKLFESVGFTEINVFNNALSTPDRFILTVKDFDAIIIDHDQFSLYFDSIIKSIRTIENKNRIKVIVLTSKTDIMEMTDMFIKGVDEVILKPFKDEVIIDKLKYVLHNSYYDHSSLIKKTIQDAKGVLSWCQDFEIGVKEIDVEHQGIIEHYEKLYNLMKSGHGHEYFPELINFLELYIGTHFAHEEKLQINVRYSEYNAYNHIFIVRDINELDISMLY